MFELACSECGHLLASRVGKDVTLGDTAVHALTVHGVPLIEPVWCWTAQLPCYSPRHQSCETPWCYRPVGLHPTADEVADAEALLAEPEFAAVVPAGAGIRPDPAAVQRRAQERAAAELVVAGGHWLLPLVRVRPKARFEIEVVRSAA